MLGTGTNLLYLIKHAKFIPFTAFLSKVNAFFIWNRQLLTTKRELTGAENELRMLQETYSDKQDSWIKEKLDLQVSNTLVLT
jgi:hypothetical protein